jgi:pilus assembly protein CpaB
MDRQKKLLLFGAAWVSALLLTWFYYANAVAPKADKTVQLVVASRDMPMGTLLRKNDIKSSKYLEKDVPKGAIFQTKTAENHVLMMALNTNEPVLLSKLSDATSVEGVSSTIDRGYRAVSVQITDVSGVAGLIQPGSHVDVLFTRPGSMLEATTSTILQDVKVLSTGRTVAVGQAIDPKAPKSPTITLVLLPNDAQKLELAKNEGRISLTLRNPLDSAQTASTEPLTTEALDPTLSDRLASARRARTPVKPIREDPKVWRELTASKAAAKKAEPEKLRVVVDVYRGDKHVQESFR